MNLPLFVTKTYELVNESWSNQVVSWNESGTSMIIWDICSLEEHVLPKYFKHKNYSSFVRQLNIYGFSKIPNTCSADAAEFWHPFFQRDNPSLLDKVIRNSKASKVTRPPEKAITSPFAQLNHINHENTTEEEIESLRKEMEYFQQRTSELQHELTSSKEELSRVLEKNPSLQEKLHSALGDMNFSH